MARGSGTPAIAEYTFFSFFKCPWNIFQEDHTLDHKTSLNKFKRMEIISSIFTDHNSAEINYRKKNGKNINT